MGVIITTVLIVSALFILLIALVVKAHKRKVVTGQQGLVGEIAEVVSDIAAGMPGSVKLHGEIWNARLQEGAGENVAVGTRVKVTEVNNLTLIVQRI
jgi:membrane-bound serine protease (ClpP class)